MVTRKKSFSNAPNSSSNSKMKYSSCNADTNRGDSKGTKPLPDPPSVTKIILMMVIHVCRKVLFVDTSVKVGIYGAALFLVSLVADFSPMPKSYLSRSDNIFNAYFVKIGWGWTLLMTVPFVFLTSFTYCCGQRIKVLRHMARLGVATCMWFFWTALFVYIETNYGRCNVNTKTDSFNTKWKCLKAGYYWHGLDISGHAFILIYSALVIIEEARALNGWEGIGDLIRNEQYLRQYNDIDMERSSPLRYLAPHELHVLKNSYHKFTSSIQALFIAMTALTILWDVMLIGTILYYHIMIEKFLGGTVAVLMWYFTYRFAFPILLPMPGEEGLFKYQDVPRNSLPKKRNSYCPPNSASSGTPTFMGMPLQGVRTSDSASEASNTETADTLNPKWQPRRQNYFDS